MKEDCNSRSHYYLDQRHRVDRVLGFFSSRLNQDSPIPSPAGVSVLPPPAGSGGDTLARGTGGPNSDEGPVYVYFVDRGRVNM
jgi:hypothetical protein